MTNGGVKLRVKMYVGCYQPTSLYGCEYWETNEVEYLATQSTKKAIEQ